MQFYVFINNFEHRKKLGLRMNYFFLEKDDDGFTVKPLREESLDTCKLKFF
jgi:hypothetical protein